MEYLEQADSYRGRLEVTMGWGRNDGESLCLSVNGYRTSVRDDDKVLEMHGGDGCVTLKVLMPLSSTHLKTLNWADFVVLTSHPPSREGGLLENRNTWPSILSGHGSCPTSAKTREIWVWLTWVSLSLMDNDNNYNKIFSEHLLSVTHCFKYFNTFSHHNILMKVLVLTLWGVCVCAHAKTSGTSNRGVK
jgi:hypothetical protein